MQETAHLVARTAAASTTGCRLRRRSGLLLNAGDPRSAPSWASTSTRWLQRLVAEQMPDAGWNCWAETRPSAGISRKHRWT